MFTEVSMKRTIKKGKGKKGRKGRKEGRQERRKKRYSEGLRRYLSVIYTNKRTWLDLC